MRRLSKMPSDPNAATALTAKLATDEQTQGMPQPAALAVYFSAIGQRGGLKGGKARAEALSRKKRSEIARKAAKARWRAKKTG
ncbi:MAG: hypothetical protein ACRD04_06865 [Terriglobales bacterium]